MTKNLQNRKDVLMMYFLKIIVKFDDNGNYIIINNGKLMPINRQCEDKDYRIKPGDYIINKQTNELFLFLGTGPLDNDKLEEFPWVLREGKYLPTVIFDRDLIEQFDEKYVLV
ncbi:MAG: hypothetical protein WCO55_02750 [Candidatus Falkowbacteria bacterium]